MSSNVGKPLLNLFLSFFHCARSLVRPVGSVPPARGQTPGLLALGVWVSAAAPSRELPENSFPTRAEHLCVTLFSMHTGAQSLGNAVWFSPSRAARSGWPHFLGSCRPCAGGGRGRGHVRGSLPGTEEDPVFTFTSGCLGLVKHTFTDGRRSLTSDVFYFSRNRWHIVPKALPTCVGDYSFSCGIV